MNVMKQDAMDIKGTTYAKYEWHTYGMQTIKIPPRKRKGCKSNFLPLKRIEQLLEKNILSRKKLRMYIDINILSFILCKAWHYVTHVPMHISTSKHDYLRLYNIALIEIKIQACKVFSCDQVSCKLTLASIVE